jgi:heavy metal sensor kinase
VAGLRLSIGAKWALRYAVATLITISLLAVFVYDRVERRIVRDAELIAKIPLRNISEAMKRNPGDIDLAIEVINREVRAADGDLRLGIQFFDDRGRLLYARGGLEQQPLPLPRGVLSGRRPALSWQRELGGGRRWYVVSADAPGGFLQTAIYSRRFDKHAAYIRDGFYLALPIAVLLTVVLGWLLARRSLRPIARITSTARHIGVAQLDEQVPTTGSGDELDQLAGTLNEMLGRLRESVARIRRFNADAAHELRTPLAAIRNQIEVTVEKSRKPEEYEAVLRQLLDEVDRLASGTSAMLRLAQSEAGIDPAQRAEVDVGEVLSDVVDFFEPLASEADVKLEYRTERGANPIIGDAGWLHQLFANLVHNAVKFTPAGGSVAVSLAPDAEADGVVASVEDTGMGISEDRLERIFERFHKVDASRSQSGFGLGLSLAREITRAHGGRIEVESRYGEGTLFRVFLPSGTAPEE